MTEEIKVEQPNGAAPETASTAAEAPATETADNDLNLWNLWKKVFGSDWLVTCFYYLFEYNYI